VSTKLLLSSTIQLIAHDVEQIRKPPKHSTQQPKLLHASGADHKKANAKFAGERKQICEMQKSGKSTKSFKFPHPINSERSHESFPSAGKLTSWRLLQVATICIKIAK